MTTATSTPTSGSGMTTPAPTAGLTPRSEPPSVADPPSGGSSAFLGAGERRGCKNFAPTALAGLDLIKASSSHAGLDKRRRLGV